MEKYHKQEVSPVEEENERDGTFEADNPQIDIKRTKNNYHMNSNAFGGYTEFINKRLKELGLKPRKDAVVMNSFVVGSDKAFFDSLPKMQQYSFFSDCAKFFEERYGQENVISAVVHLDETTPHMHLNLIPITPDGRLCSKDLFDKDLISYLIKEVQIYPNDEPAVMPLKSITLNFPIYIDNKEVNKLLWDKQGSIETLVMLERKNP